MHDFDYPHPSPAIPTNLQARPSISNVRLRPSASHHQNAVINLLDAVILPPDTRTRPHVAKVQYCSNPFSAQDQHPSKIENAKQSNYQQK